MITIHEHSFEEDAIPSFCSILDLGGNRGQFAQAFFELFPLAHVVSYEPTHALLESNRTNWTVVEKAIALKDGVETLSLFVDKSWCNSLVFKDGAQSTMQVVTQDIRPLIPNFDLIKMDIEGSEYPILEGLTIDELRQCRQWSVEFHCSLYPEYRQRTWSIIRKFLRAGFHIGHIDDTFFDVSFIR